MRFAYLGSLVLLLPASLSLSVDNEIKYTDAAISDQVLSLPGADALAITFNQFSGYIDVRAEKAERPAYMHYWFVESERDPKNDPVVLWTNGGPGCSGMLGLFTEQGPFKPDGNGTLQPNPYAWNRVANMIFVEQPVGVGFSYAEAGVDYVSGDRQAAKANYRGILAFFERFPHLKANELYLTSESYGGHYLPTLTAEILKQQQNATFKLNFKGFTVGNPYTSWLNNRRATYESFWGHQLVAQPTYNMYRYTCSHIRDSPSYIKACTALEAAMNKEIGNLNPYALDYPVCLTGRRELKAGRAQRAWLMHHLTPKESSGQLGIMDINDYEPCEDNYLVKYLNRDDVKAAIHVKPDLRWTECSAVLRYNRADMLVPMEGLYKRFIDGGHGLKILVYSGDDDSVCATWGTQEWIWGLGYRVAGAHWAQWHDQDQQVAGYVTQFEGGLTFVTVHGAGHEVPTYTPGAALELFKAYLNGTWFDTAAFV